MPIKPQGIPNTLHLLIKRLAKLTSDGQKKVGAKAAELRGSGVAEGEHKASKRASSDG